MRRWWVIVWLALALLAVACGDSKEAALDVVTGAPDATTEARSAKVELTIGLDESQALHATGAFDFTRGLGQLEMDASSLLGQAAPTGDNGRLSMLIAHGVLYMHFPLLSSLLPDAKEWIKLDPDTIGEQSGLPGGIGQVGQVDPTQALQYLRGAAKVTEVGADKLKGEDVTHYTAEFDLARAIDQARDHLSAELKKSLPNDASGTLPADVWIDAKGRLRKLTFNLTDAAKAAGAPAAAAGAGAFTMELFDFGTAVDEIEVPSEADTSDFGELLDGLGTKVPG